MTTLPPNAGLDPVSVEVVRMRLDSIVEEMGSAMIRSSGSPVITESGDLNTALMDPAGRIYAYSDFVQLHIGSGGVSVRNLVEVIGDEPLRPGDAFISNDPHTAGSSHPPDTNVISPVFYQGELVAWAQSQAHLLDVGGMAAGGFAPDAFDCFGEGVRVPPGVKIFDAGEPIEWVRRLLLNNVRIPALYWNDVRSLVASNNTGIRRLVSTIDEFGLEKFKRYTAASFELAERVVRGRIALMPNGTYEVDEWVEHDGHRERLYRVHCAMTKSGDQLTLDLTGSSPQSDGFMNCSLGATIGMVASAIMPILAWDVPFNEGVMTACQVTAEPGTIVNPIPPAPISNGHLLTGNRVARVVTKVFNEAFRGSDNDDMRRRTQGVWSDSWTGGITAGVKDDGEFFVLFNMDGGAMGSGAQSVADGLDCGGMMTQLNSTLPDVEMNEMMYPVLYLWKQLDLPSAGHGAHRGGLGVEFAWTLHGADAATQTVFAPVAQVVPDGFGGGLPGGGSGHELWRDTPVRSMYGGADPLTAEALGAGERQLLELSQQTVGIAAGDVFRQRICGGGGYGDPLLRPAEVVAKNLADGYITPTAASEVYGVVVGENGLDEDATRARRDSIRARRLGGETPARQVRAQVRPDDSAPRRGPDGWYCPASGAVLSSGDNWRDNVIARTHVAVERLAELGIHCRAHDESDGWQVLLDEFISPECGTLLDTRIRVQQAAGSHGTV